MRLSRPSGSRLLSIEKCATICLDDPTVEECDMDGVCEGRCHPTKGFSVTISKGKYCVRHRV